MPKERVVLREGFWGSVLEPLLPMPHPEPKPWKGQKEFVAQLKALQDKIGTYRHYRGFSTCRLCKCINGAADYTHRDWVWPEGYLHYIEKHNVRPSLAFQDFVARSAPARKADEKPTAKPARTAARTHRRATK